MTMADVLRNAQDRASADRLTLVWPERAQDRVVADNRAVRFAALEREVVWLREEVKRRVRVIAYWKEPV